MFIAYNINFISLCDKYLSTISDKDINNMDINNSSSVIKTQMETDYRFFFYKDQEGKLWHWNHWQDVLTFSISMALGGYLEFLILTELDGRVQYKDYSESPTKAVLRNYLPDFITKLPLGCYFFIFMYSAIIWVIRFSYTKTILEDYLSILALNFCVAILAFGTLFPFMGLPQSLLNPNSIFNKLLSNEWAGWLPVCIWISSIIFIPIFGAYILSNKLILYLCLAVLLLIYIIVIILEILNHQINSVMNYQDLESNPSYLNQNYQDLESHKSYNSMNNSKNLIQSSELQQEENSLINQNTILNQSTAFIQKDQI